MFMCIILKILYKFCDGQLKWSCGHTEPYRNFHSHTIFGSGGPKWTPQTHSNYIPNCCCTYLNADENPRCLATRSKTNTSFPCSCKRNVFASTSRKIRLKCSLSTRNRWQLFSFNTIVAALEIGKEKRKKKQQPHAYTKLINWLILFALLSLSRSIQIRFC